MLDLGNTRAITTRRGGGYQHRLVVSDRDRGGVFGTYAEQDCDGTLRQVELQRQIKRADGKLYLGSIPEVHYAEMLRYARLERMDDPTWQAFVRGYLSHASFRKFRGNGNFHERTLHDFFFDMLDNPRELTKFFARRLADLGLLRA